MSDNKQRLVLGILDFLQQSINDGTVKSDDVEGLEVAIQCIGEAFGVDPADDSQRQRLSIKPATLQNVFDVFLKTREKLGGSTSQSTAAATPPTGPTAADKVKAEAHKQAGNQLMSQKKYGDAIEEYTSAIALDPTNPVYYSNRAAAHSSQDDHYSAIEDAQKAIEVNPKFAKAYSRLGHAHYCLEDFESAKSAYEDGLAVEPTNQAMKTGLESSKSKLASPASSAPTTSPTRSPPAGGGGMPDLASLMGALGGGGGRGGGGGGGGLDIASLMSNPMVMQMAQQMMSNGGMDQLMNNPSVRNMAERMQSGGGMPSMDEIMSDPALRDMASKFGRGPGGGAGAGNV